jgi:hypothetical protein
MVQKDGIFWFENESILKLVQSKNITRLFKEKLINC